MNYPPHNDYNENHDGWRQQRKQSVNDRGEDKTEGKREASIVGKELGSQSFPFTNSGKVQVQHPSIFKVQGQ